MLNVGNRQREQQEHTYGGSFELSMYDQPPCVEVTLEDFEQFAISRLHVLKAVENYRLSNSKLKDKEISLERVIAKHMPITHNQASKLSNSESMRDALSHFFLRIAFCQTEELRRWFVQHESALFRFRLDKLTRNEKLTFLKQNGISVDEASPGEVEERKSKLIAARNASTTDRKERLRPLPLYFKVPFTHVLDLIGSRKVLLERGIAYVPFDQVVSILNSRFRANLSRNLATAYRKYNQTSLSRDQRLLPVLNNLTKHHIDADYSVRPDPAFASGETITANDIDALSKLSMPLCMQNLYKALSTHHHLRFEGRQQFGLFLKGIGLQLEEAINFWRQKFCTKITVEEFNKKYMYNIRHNYGKEGKRKDYVPYSCMSIITGNPPKTGEYHACPFRHFDENQLRKAMHRTSDIEKNEIVKLVQGRHYQIACRTYFEATHPGYNGGLTVSHPNRYFEESRRYYAQNAKAPAT